MMNGTSGTYHGPRSHSALRAARAFSRAVDVPSAEALSYVDLRMRYVLVERRPEDDAVVLTLRLDGAEQPDARDRLRRLGFEPNASPVRSAISWRRRLADAERGPLCTALREALGDAVVLDLGASFADHGSDAFAHAKRAGDWSGRCLVHVGGTRRGVVFAREAEADEFARAFDASRQDWFDRDFRPATE
jgi:hypothetical protein